VVSSLDDLRRTVGTRPWLMAVFVGGLVLRTILIPITHGQDFVVWEKASAATLSGVNIYAHHPHYPAGPYAYFPLFVYLELPFQWLSQHIGIPFTVLGKIPIAVGDTVVAAILAAELTDRGHGPRAVAAGTALFFLNPLVLDNSALYGRFDSLGCALLLLALRGIRKAGSISARDALWYALAVAVKTFPGFAVLGFLRAGRTSGRRVALALAVVLGALTLPYLGSMHAYLHDIVLYNAGKNPQGLSWQQVFLHLTGVRTARTISYLLLILFALGAVWLSGEIEDLATCTLLTLLLFILCSKVVLSHYLIWPMPWLILRAFPSATRYHRSSALILALYTLLGMQMNPYFHPFGQYPEWASYLLAATTAAYLMASVRRQI
jgi:hypothetical protein